MEQNGPESITEENISENTQQEFKIGNQQFDEYIQNVFQNIMKATRVSNTLPSGDEHSVYMMNKFFKESMDRNSSSLLSSVSRFSKQLGDNMAMEEMEDVQEQYDSAVDLLDQYFENIDMALDEIDMANKPQHQKKILQEMEKKGLSSKATTSRLLRPQADWNIDNSNTNFVPLIKEKPNAIVPLEESLKKTDSINVYDIGHRYSGPGVGGLPNRDSYPHPYGPELRELEFMDWQLQPCKETLYKGLGNVTCTWIDTKEDLIYLANKLDSLQEFAIDLEQHCFRSFQGFVCLMQISTRNEDYLIDTLEVREHMHVLNSSFTNPKIVKVLHGADNDILWLQRDFGLYIVNMFDTGQASRVLEYPSFSLTYLLKYYCGVEADKKYQLHDWRVRPLPSEMVKYARQDTHYLLYIYDRLRNELYNKGGSELLKVVLLRSKEICLRRYEKELFSETSYLSLLNRSDITLTPKQVNVFRAIYKWRDATARREDESTRYVMTNNMIFEIAKTCPTEIQTLLECCKPVPPLVRKNKTLLLKIIEQAMNGIIDDDLILGKEQVVEEATPQKKMDVTLNLPMYNQEEGNTFTPIVDRHLSLQSPVMTTDQLYKHAGWVEQPTSTILSFEEEKDEEYHKIGRRVDDVKTMSSSSLFNDSHMHMDGRDFEKVAQIKASFTFDNLHTPVKGNQVQDDVRTPQQPLVEENKVEELTPPDERVPKSLKEIYTLSQQNRKKNKQKKQLKQDSIPDPSPAFAEEKILSEPAEFMKEIGWVKSVEDVPVIQDPTEKDDDEKKRSSNFRRGTFSKRNFVPHNYGNTHHKKLKKKVYSQSYQPSGIKMPSNKPKKYEKKYQK